MDTPKWVERLSHAKTPEEVVLIVNEYVEARDERLLAQLPEECRISKVRSADEVVANAYRLAIYRGHDDFARVVQRFSAFFGRASVRLAEMARLRPGSKA